MATNTLVVLIPGTTATTLIDPLTRQVAWGGTASEVVLDADAGNAAAADNLLESPLLEVGTIAGWIPAQPPGYGALQMLLANTYGFDTALVTGSGNVPAKLGAAQLLGFAYDWRRDNVQTANILQSVLEQADRIIPKFLDPVGSTSSTTTAPTASTTRRTSCCRRRRSRSSHRH